MEVELRRMQAFFPASLEIQEELLEAGFKVPYDKESGRKTLVPVVVSSREERRLRRNRVLKAKDFESDGKFALVPGERAIMEIEPAEKGFLILRPKPLEYHLEEMGFVSVPPRIWGTRAGLSIPFSFYETLADFLDEFRREETDGLYLASHGTGKRIEVYAYKGRTRKDLGIPPWSARAGRGRS